MRCAVLPVILVMASTLARAGPTADEMAAEVADNVASEYAECSVYFSIVSGALARVNQSADARKYDETSDKAAMFSLMAAKQSRDEAMATKVTLARLEISLKDMLATIGNNYSNISLLSNKYLTPCIESMQDSASLIKRWTQKVQSKYGKVGQPKEQ